jgi:hypothetical protein
MRIPASAVLGASAAVGEVNRALASKRSVARRDLLRHSAEPRRDRRASNLKGEWNVYMQTTLKPKHSVPRGARGLIVFWILSFPMALAAMVYALGML